MPALNEEVTIRDSVQRLLDLGLRRMRVIVIDDASDDRTPEILAGIDHPNLTVLRRDPPDAQQGKAAALNNAYRIAATTCTTASGRSSSIVDADGRLHPDAPAFAAAHFADPAVGGVQSLVRIYNRQHLLTWLQDVEFSVYGYLFQAGRDDWGTAGHGRQRPVQPARRRWTRSPTRDGPWRDRLTEDQDLGLRLIGAGWEGRQELRATVDQQGVASLRRLLNQRTRWSQGNLQAMDLLGEVRRAPFGLGARLRDAALPADAGLAGDRRRRPGRGAGAGAVRRRAASGAAARPGSSASSTCSPSAARSSAASPRAPRAGRSAGCRGC